MKKTIKTALTTTLLSSLLIATPAQAGGERDPLLTYFLMDTLEVSEPDAPTTSWGATAWVGKDWHKLYFKTEGASVDGNTESENQLLYSRPIGKFWDIQLGLGYDTTPESNQTWGVISLQGLAPYYFETNASLLVNDKNVGLRVETELEILFTQKLILTPSLALAAYTADDADMDIEAGLSSSEVGLRLRYEFSRKFAPYLGVTTNPLKNAETETPNATAVAGIRFWF